jgi:hypothetical protein
MQRLTELLNKKKQLKELRSMMDKDAELYTEEGMAYSKLLVKLVLIELEIEDMEKAAL